MADGERLKRGGRPRKYEEQRPILTFRIPSHAHARLKESAAQHGRSISEEIERRLELSFGQEDQAGRSGAATLDLLQAFGHAISLIESVTGKAWAQDPFTAVAARDAIQWVLANKVPAEIHVQQRGAADILGRRAGDGALVRDLRAQLQVHDRELAVLRLELEGLSREEAIARLSTEPKSSAKDTQTATGHRARPTKQDPDRRRSE